MEKQAFFEVTVRRDLEDLLPAFLENRRGELAALHAALTAANLDDMRRIAGMMKAVGNSFGFVRVEELGAEIEDAASRSDFDAVYAYIALYDEFLRRVRIRIEPEK